MLMYFFEKTLTQIKESHQDTPLVSAALSNTSEFDDQEIVAKTKLVRQRGENSLRVFTAEEQFKFTKASYQFIVRLMRLKLIADEVMEDIINQLLLSDSSFVTLQETKWAIRNTLSHKLDAKQLAFLDLVLYQKEDKLPLH
jgi:Smg protein